MSTTLYMFYVYRGPLPDMCTADSSILCRSLATAHSRLGKPSSSLDHTGMVSEDRHVDLAEESTFRSG